MAKTKAKAKKIVEKSAAEIFQPPPNFIHPQLVADKGAIPNGDQWIHEIKHDGWRLQARIDNGKVTLRTRKGMDVTKDFKLVAEELSKLQVNNAIIDGEITAPYQAELPVKGSASRGKKPMVIVGGLTFLSDLRRAMSNNKRLENQKPFHYFVFDLMFLNGQDITSRPLLERKEKLEALVGKKPEHIHFVAHMKAAPESLIEVGSGFRLEGFVSKLENSVYRSGRHNTWLKYKFRKHGWKKDYV